MSELIVLDIDRTILNTTNFSAAMVAPLKEELNLSAPQLERMQEIIQRHEGQVFNYLTWLADEADLNPQQLSLLADADRLSQAILGSYTDDNEELSAAFIKRVLVPGVPELVRAIEQTDAQLLLLTAGGTVLQSIKVVLMQRVAQQLALTSQPPDAVIVPAATAKAELIETSFTGDNFSLEPLRQQATVFAIADPDVYSSVTHATIIDDKYSNLVSQGGHTTGLPVYIEGDPNRAELNEAQHRALGLAARQSLYEIATTLGR